MAKEKNRNLASKENERVFHYEILGIVLLVLSMFAIAKLGLIGQYLMLIVKFLFGDWYFLIFGLIIFYAIRCIIVHKRLKIINIRYLGIFILILALILLSHFSMHKYIKNYSGNHLVFTIKLYFNSFKNNNPESIVGGGFIGACIFYLSYYLLSEVGVVLLSILLVFLGIVFISRKTIKDFIKMIINFFNKIYKLLHRATNKIKSKIDEYDASYIRSKVKFKISKVNSDEYYQKEIDFAKRNGETIKKVLNGMNVFYNDITYIICRNITVYFINTYYPFNYQVFEMNLQNYLHHFQLKKDEKAQELLVEVNSLNNVALRISEIEKLDDNEIVFGVDDRNELLKLDDTSNRLFIFGQNKNNVTTYLDSIIISLMHYKSKIKYYYIDLLNLSNLQTSNNFDEINHILTLIDEKSRKFNELKISNIEEYNLKNAKKMNYELIIINGIEKVITDEKSLEKLMYILEVTNNYGYFFIYTCYDGNIKNVNLANLFQYKLFLDHETECSKKFINYQRFNLLNVANEGYLLYKTIILRMTLLLMSESEKNSIKN